MPILTIALVPDGAPVFVFLLSGILGGLLMGLIVGAFTGLVLTCLLSSTLAGQPE